MEWLWRSITLQRYKGNFDEDREQVIREDFPHCPKHGALTTKDLITVYPEGHTHANA